MIKLKNVSKTIGKNQILKDISMELHPGKIYVFKGINGCGKSMLMKTISGIIMPTSGDVEVFGKRMGKDISYVPSVGMLIENPSFLPGYTGLVNLMLLARLGKKDGVEEMCQNAMKRVGLDPSDKRKYKQYSLGMKQKLGIAAAIMEENNIIILDEPFNALDEASTKMAEKIIKSERDRGAIVLLATHLDDKVYNLADEIFIMENGTIKSHELNYKNVI